MKGENANMDELDRLTEEQHNLCYELQFALMRAIVNLDHEKMWKLIKDAIGKEKNERSN